MIEGVLTITQPNKNVDTLFNVLKDLNFEPQGVRQEYFGDTLNGFAIRITHLMKDSKALLRMIRESCGDCRVTLLAPQGFAFSCTKNEFLIPIGTYSKLTLEGKVTTSNHSIYIPKTQSTYLIK